jgi:hypothetical protein
VWLGLTTEPASMPHPGQASRALWIHGYVVTIDITLGRTCKL